MKEQLVLEIKHLLVDLESENELYYLRYKFQTLIENIIEYYKKYEHIDLTKNVDDYIKEQIK